MSRSDDGNFRDSRQHWWLAACVLAVPLAWVGTQAADEPLYAVNGSVHGLHSSLPAVRASTPMVMAASGLGDARPQGMRALFAAHGLGARTGFDTPLLSATHGKGMGTKRKEAGRLSLSELDAQAYQLAVTDVR